jgi:hypothetical protein
VERIRIGCSGWNYKHWRERFYPKGVPVSRWFAFYAETFDTVEINNSFYMLPKAETFDKWRDQAAPDFRYAVKANRFLTQAKKLKDCEEPLQRMLPLFRRLGDTLGPILYQLPPRFRINLERLESFLKLLPTDLVHVFEFRERSWYVPETLSCWSATARLLRPRHAGFGERAVGRGADRLCPLPRRRGKILGPLFGRGLLSWTDWAVRRRGPGVRCGAYSTTTSTPTQFTTRRRCAMVRQATRCRRPGSAIDRARQQRRARQAPQAEDAGPTAWPPSRPRRGDRAVTHTSGAMRWLPRQAMNSQATATTAQSSVGMNQSICRQDARARQPASPDTIAAPLAVEGRGAISTSAPSVQQQSSQHQPPPQRLDAGHARARACSAATPPSTREEVRPCLDQPRGIGGRDPANRDAGQLEQRRPTRTGWRGPAGA